MIAIEFYKVKAKKESVKEFRINNLKNRNTNKLEKIQQWCEKYLHDVDGVSYDFNDVIEAEPAILLRIKKHLDETYGDDLYLIMKELPFTNDKCYIETSLYTNMKKGAKKILFEKLNTRVCPYCNRNYVFSNEKIRTCELDHFIPKRKYPIFASSFYNLIPTCSYCNKRKHEKEFYFYPHNHKKTTDETLKFSYTILGPNYLSDLNDIGLELVIIDSEYKEQAETLNLQELYETHKDIVQEILIKKEIFSEKYINGLYKEFKNIFSTEQDLREIIYGTPLNANEYGKKPLSKLTKDILDEIG